jgi:hypothetical protein
MNWYSNAQREIETFFDINQVIPKEEGTERLKGAIDGFHDLFIRLIKELGIRDTWPKTLCHIAPFESGVIEHSEKMLTEYTIGVSIHGWFAQATIVSPHCLRHMKDDYWNYIVKLSALGKAELVDYGRPPSWADSKEKKKLVQHKGSLVFSMLRDYTLIESKFGNCDSLGAIQIHLDLDSTEEKIEAFFKSAIDGLYRSNYLLHRSDYINQKRIEKQYINKRSNE